MSEPNLPEAIRLRLAALPEIAPSDALWLRIARAQPPVRARRWPYAVAATAAALAAFAIGIVVLEPPSPAFQPDRALAEARTLEQALADARVRGVTNPDVRTLERELASADAALQDAVDRRAASRELDALWRERLVRLAALVDAYRHPDTLVRI